LNDHKTVALISRFMTLNPGDIILTGTPANAENSVIADGDTVELEIENIGTLKNTVSLIDEP
jgi:2-keto-4-pentenoate hydratase/2-oxohepta-3-ene-1,7-dioic acid hydratase in catechol pathway